ncbi:MAG: phage tail protein [Pseudomonadota bacterium]
MATTIKDIKNEYPIPVYRFSVNIGAETMAFSEVSGLDIGVEAITYNDGQGILYMPGKPIDVNITLKRGIVHKKHELYNWISSTRLNLVEKKDITISLVNEKAEALVTWTVKNAFPTKLSGPSLNGGSNEVSIESLEMRADDIRIENK